MNSLRLVGLLVLPWCCASSVLAEPVTHPSVSPTSTLAQQRTLNSREVRGLIVGQTMTLAGRVFYDSFASAWNDQNQDGHFNVSIIERPTARLGSQVFVDYGNRRMYQVFLPPNRTLIPEIAAGAAAQVYQSILDYQLAQFFGDPDMARDEY